MKKTNSGVWLGMGLLLLSSVVRADNLNQQLMTARDIVSNSYSNITIQNKTGASTTIYGLYVNQFASAIDNDCTAPTVLYAATWPAASAAGAVVAPVSMPTNQKISVGQNYLYNMLYTAIYYGNQPTITMPCWLPGCTWAGDASPAEKWCVYVGVLAPASDNTASTASVPPFAAATSGTGYNYDLVTNYGYVGPITCNDQTLTCSVATAQTVAFPY